MAGIRSRILLGIAVIAACVAAVTGCGSSQELETISVSTTAASHSAPKGRIVAGVGKPQTFARAHQIHEQYGDLIDERFEHVVGHGVGLAGAAESGQTSKPGSRSFAIVVIVKGPLPAKSYELSGVPLRFQRTSGFDAQDPTLQAQ